MDIKAIIIWLSLGFTATVFGVLILELAARAWLKLRDRWYPWPPFSRYELHLKPGVFPQFPPITRLWINRLGARGDEPPRLLDETFRIVVAGGSAAECYFLDQPQTWPEQLANALRRDDSLTKLKVKAVHLDNFARSGFRCADVVTTLQKTTPNIGKIDCLVLMVGAGDIIRWMEQGPSTKASNPAQQTALFALHPHVTGFWWRVVAIKRVVHWLKLKFIQPLQIRHDVGKALEIARTRRSQHESSHAPIPEPSAMLETFETSLNQLIDVGRNLAPNLILVQQPHFGRTPSPEEKPLMWNFGNGPVFERPVDSYYSHDDVIQLWQTVNGIVAKVGKLKAITSVVNGQDAVRSGAECFYDFAHLNPNGAKLLGEEIAAALLASKLK